MKVRLQEVLWPLVGLLVGLLLLGNQPRVHALPEYATRTGEPCAACHVNPAGGGPRTARGALWVAQGRPDQLPQLPASSDSGSKASAGSESEVEASDSATTATPEGKSAAPSDGKALFERLSCAACHGAAGEGGTGPALNSAPAANAAEAVLRHGQGIMPGYSTDALSDVDLASVVQYLHTLAGGEAKEPTDAQAPGADEAASNLAAAAENGGSTAVSGPAVPQPESTCGGASTVRSCGGN